MKNNILFLIDCYTLVSPILLIILFLMILIQAKKIRVLISSNKALEEKININIQKYNEKLLLIEKTYKELWDFYKDNKDFVEYLAKIENKRKK